MRLPRLVHVGAGIIDEIGSLPDSAIDVTNSIIVSDEKTHQIAANDLEEQLKSNNYKATSIQINRADRQNIDLVKKKISPKTTNVIGVGGGTVIDVAKVAAHESDKNFISVPTSAAHDGIASPFASIKSKKPGSILASTPIAIIADSDIISKAPYKFISAGCGDIISKYTAIRDWDLAKKVKREYVSDYSRALSLMTAKLVTKSAKKIANKSEKGIRTIVKALISSGVAMAIAGSSRPASGSEHKFSHALDMIYKENALHGEQTAVGSIMMMYLHGGDWEQIREVLCVIGAPTTAKELGIPDKYIIKALLYATKIRPQRYTILEHHNLDKKKAKEIAKETSVI